MYIGCAAGSGKETAFSLRITANPLYCLPILTLFHNLTITPVQRRAFVANGSVQIVQNIPNETDMTEIQAQFWAENHPESPYSVQHIQTSDS